MMLICSITSNVFASAKLIVPSQLFEIAITERSFLPLLTFFCSRTWATPWPLAVEDGSWPARSASTHETGRRRDQGEGDQATAGRVRA